MPPYYTREPLYGELVRTALRLGYTVVPYEESHSNCQSPPDDPDYCQNRREKSQAQNLFERILKNDAQARMLVHAGYGHIDKKGSGGWIPMAKYFQEITDIEPLAVDQEVMREHSSPRFENADYREALKLFKPDQPIVLESKDGSFWVEPWRRGSYDIQVIHPRTRYSQGRPDWILLNGVRKLVPFPKETQVVVPPYLVRAYYAAESSAATPADQLMVAKGDKRPALALPTGRFRVQLVGTDGRIISESTLNVP